MNFISYAKDLHELSILKDSGVTEVILSHPKLSRIFKGDDFVSLATAAKELGLKVTLEWDTLITENDFEEYVTAFKEISSSLYDVVRVQDQGVLQYILEETESKIQFVSETGNHNLIGLKKWESYIGDRLDRIVLSIELNKDKIAEYVSALNCDTEILSLGRVLLFYSPRKLLSTLLPEDDEKRTKSIVSDNFLEAIGESEESPHKGFPLVENRHGTFMFHIKDLFLLDKIQELQNTNISHLRIDLRHKSSDLLRLALSSDELNQNYLNLKTAYGKDVIRGYFQINKSDVLFKKLKNYRIQRKDDSYLGDVIEIVKGEYMAINLRSENNIRLGDSIKFINPEGKTLKCKVHTLKDLAFQDQKFQSKDQIALMNYMGGVWPKSQAYLDSSN